MEKLKKIIAAAMSVSMLAGPILGAVPVKAAEQNKQIAIDFSTTDGIMEPKSGFLLIPNEDIPDGRILPLHARMVRDDIDTQNLLGNNGNNNNASNSQDYLPNEHNRLNRIEDGVARLDELGIDYYPIMGYHPSWVSNSGLAKGRPKNMQLWKQWVKDIAQYMKDKELSVDEFNVWNEDWGFYSDPALYADMHENAWYAIKEILPEAGLIGPSLQDPTAVNRCLRLIDDCAEREIPIEVLSWHFMDDAPGIVQTLENKVAEKPIVGSPKYYYEEYSWNHQHGVNNFEVLAKIDQSGVDEAVRGIWNYPNGLSDMIRTDQTQENPNYRLAEWWHTAAYGSMSGMRVKNPTSEPYIASIDEEKGEAKVLIGYRNATAIDMDFENLPFGGNVKVDKYEVTKSVSRVGIKDRVNDMDENAGIQYVETLDSTDFTMNFEADRIYMFVIKSDDSVPSDFYLKTPDDNGIVTDSPTLTWQKSEGAESYTVTVALDKKMKDVVFEKSGITGEECTVDAELAKDQMYYWTVTAHNANGDRAPLNNMYYSFTVKENTQVPGSFTLLQVINGAENVSLTPKFLWSKSRNADKYVLELAADKAFSDIQFTKEITAPTNGAVVDTCGIVLDEKLQPGTGYYARLWAENANGRRAMNGESHWFSTTTSDNVPQDFALTYPSDGAVIEQRETLRWEKKPGAFFYELEVATDEEFQNVVLKSDTITQAAYTFESADLEPDTTYYWRVAATNKENDVAKRLRTQSSSGIYSFTTSSKPAAPLVKVSNPTGAGSIVIWKPVLGADSYTVKFGTEPGNYTGEIQGVTADRAYVPMSGDGYCTVVAVKDGVESDIWNEIPIKAGERAEMKINEAYQAEAADELSGADISMKDAAVYIRFNDKGDMAAYKNMVPCQALIVTYQADADTKVAVYAGDTKLGDLELNQTSGMWENATLHADIAENVTLRLVKEENGAAFKIDYFTPSSGVTLENIAKGSVVTSDSETLPLFPTTNALDADRETFWRAGDEAKEESPNWLNVDLGKVSQVYSVNVKLPTTNWGPRTQELRVLTSMDGTEYQEASAKAVYEFNNAVNKNEVKISLEQPVNAQHVKIEFYSNTGDPNYGQVGELEIMGVASKEDIDIEGVNLAYKKQVYANSISYGSVTDIVDGDKTTFADFGSKNFPNEVIVDLEAIYKLERFEMYLPANWGGRTQEIEFLSSVDGISYTSLVAKTDYRFEQNVNHVSVSLPEDSAGRFIKIIGTANDEVGKPGMQFGEFEVYGSYGERVTGIHILQEQAELKVNEAMQLDAVITPENASNQLVSWSSSDLSVASVDDKGVVTALAPGEAVIRVRTLDGNFKAMCTIVVVEDEITPVNKELLQKSYDYAMQLNTDGVVDSAVKFFENAMAQAKTVLDNPAATQEEVGVAWDNLLEGIWGLGLYKGDKTTLKILIERADSMILNVDQYVTANWQMLVDALKEAKDVDDDGDAMQGDIEPAAEALLNAILAQRFKADKSNLEGLLKKVEDLSLEGYTADSVQAFKTALARAMAVMTDDTLSESEQQIVDDAVKALADAKDGLKLASSDDNNKGDDNKDNDNGNKNSNAQSGDNGEASPKTGDGVQDALWMKLLLLMAGFAVILKIRNKRSVL